MKTTIEIDEEKLERVMALTGAKTRREAVDLALSEIERVRRLRNLLSRPFDYGKRDGPVIDPNFDLMKLRAMEIPGHASDH